MGTRRAPISLIAAVVAAAALLAPALALRRPLSGELRLQPGAPRPGGSIPDSPPPGANNWSCRPSQAHPRPVVLVHGLLANQTDNWQTISPLLANHGYCVFSLTYGTKPNVSTPFYQPGGLAPMEQSAQQLSTLSTRSARPPAPATSTSWVTRRAA